MGSCSLSSIAAIHNVPSEYATIQAAIDASVNGDTVVIAPGTYTGTGNRDIDFRGKAIAVRGSTGNSNDCVIDCNGSAAEPHRGFLFQSGEGHDSRLEGLTITRGYAPDINVPGVFSKEPYPYPGRPLRLPRRVSGGAIACISSSPVLSGLSVINNSAATTMSNLSILGPSGGGIYCFSSEVLIYKCRITNNKCTATPISHRTTMGAGIAAELGRISIENCMISCNTGESGPIGWSNNSGRGGAVSSLRGSISLKNCSITQNTAGYGGGVYTDFGNLCYIDNCTISGNIGGGIVTAVTWLPRISKPLASISNSIVWGNEGGEIVEQQLFPQVPPPVSCTYSDIGGGWAGQGNIDADPCFVKEGYRDDNDTPADANDDFWVEGDYHLRAGSPCVNSGDPNFVAEPNETDIDGQPRVLYGRVDIGADEFELPPLKCALKITPQAINRKSNQPYIQAIIRLPEGIARADIDGNEPLTLYPCGVKASRQWTIPGNDHGQASIIAFFDKEALMNAVPTNGQTQLTASGKLKSGQYFVGTDTVKIIGLR
jgi:hypothetical protein